MTHETDDPVGDASMPRPVVASKRLYMRAFGCQMNVYDSERMGEQMSDLGYAETDDMADADLIVLNTCHIREKAAEKVYSELGRIRQIKSQREAQGKETVVTVAGCVAQAEGAEIVRRAPAVDLVVGPQSYHRLPELVHRTRLESRAIVDTSFPEESKFEKLPERSASRAGNRDLPRAATAFVTVQEGCDKFCTFCVVPYTRGAELSRPVARIADELKRLVSLGVREVTLLGQNVNGYHGEGPDGRAWTLAMLIRHLAQVAGIERLRYTTSHPRDMTEDLLAVHRDEPKLMPYLHLPFQAGADRILAAMNRKHTAADYLRLIERIRSARPDIALSTDIIVGFPGETEAEFKATLDLVEDVQFAQAYSFKYSARPGTPASTMDGQLDEAVKAERLQRLQDLLDRQQRSFNASCVGKTFPVLFEKTGRREGQLIGRSPYLQSVHAEAQSALLGRIIPVEIMAAGPNSLSGAVRAA